MGPPHPPHQTRGRPFFGARAAPVRLRPARAGLERAFGRPVIFAECFAYPRFGIEKYPPADDSIGNLPRVAQGLQCSGGDMQVSAHLLPGQVAFSQDRGAVAVQRPASVFLRPTRECRTVVIFCASNHFVFFMRIGYRSSASARKSILPSRGITGSL